MVSKKKEKSQDQKVGGAKGIIPNGLLLVDLLMELFLANLAVWNTRLQSILSSARRLRKSPRSQLTTSVWLCRCGCKTKENI